MGKWKGTEGEVSTLTLGATGSYKDDAGDLYMIGTYTVDSADERWFTEKIYQTVTIEK